jgi:hypothetical protein
MKFSLSYNLFNAAIKPKPDVQLCSSSATPLRAAALMSLATAAADAAALHVYRYCAVFS